MPNWIKWVLWFSVPALTTALPLVMDNEVSIADGVAIALAGFAALAAKQTNPIGTSERNGE